jgi:hypothetical protein
LAFSVSGTGFQASSPIFAETCDGTDPNSGTLGNPWLPAEHCDNATPGEPSDGTGAVTFDPTDLNHRYLPFEGLSKQQIFNCLAPNDPIATDPGFVQGQPDPNNFAPDWTNCKLRVAASLTMAVAGDQAFLPITLPNIITNAKDPSGPISCTAELQEAIKPGVQATYLKPPKSFTVKSIKQNTVKNIPGSAAGSLVPGGSCDISGVRGGKAPITAAVIQVSYKVGAPWDCNATGANNLFSPNVLPKGKLSITWESGPVAGKYAKVDSTKAVITTVLNNALLPSTKFQIQTAPVLKGAFQGFRIQLNVTSDTVGINNPNPPSLKDSCQNGATGLTTESFTVAGSSLVALP